MNLSSVSTSSYQIQQRTMQANKPIQTAAMQMGNVSTDSDGDTDGSKASSSMTGNLLNITA